MDKSQDLASQIKKLDKQELEVLSLKYGSGQNYRQIAETLKIPVNEVGPKLLAALKQLRADDAPAIGDAERAGILGFIHGELDQSDLQTMAARIEEEPSLRQEFEAWLAISDELEKVLAKPSKKPEPAPAAARSRKKFWAAVVGVLLVSLALPFLKKSENPESELPAVALHGREIPPAPEGQAVPPADNLAAEGEHAAQLGESSPPAAESAAANAQASATRAQPASIPPTKKMGVFTSKVKVSKNLNSKKVLLALQQRLDGKPSCVPAKLAHLKAVSVKIKLAADGGIASMESDPKNKLLNKCLKQLLADKPVAFKAKRGVASVALALKNF